MTAQLTPEVPLPLSSVDLIQMLDEVYPPLCLAPGQSMEDAHRYAGKRELIDEMIQMREETLHGVVPN